MVTFTFRRQPLKACYLTFNVLLLVFLKVPFWTLLYAFPSARPRRSWSLGRSILVQAYRAFVDTMYNTTFMTAPSSEKSAAEADAVGFVWVDAAPELVIGEIKKVAELNGVVAEKTSGFWHGRKGDTRKPGHTASPDEKVIYHMHGGAFVMGTAHPSSGPMKTCFDGMLQYFPGEPRIFAVEYRISSTHPFPPSNPFPAALLDAVAGYKYLVQVVGFKPQNIIISGDSAGGLLALWLSRYLAILGHSELQNAGGLLLLSPTVDWANTRVDEDSSMRKHSSSDFVHIILASGYTLRALLGNIPLEEAPTSSWIAPGSAVLEQTGLYTGLPPSCIVTGGAEQTLDGMVVLRDKMVADMGANRVKYLEVSDATHDFLTASWHEPERTNTLKELANWVRDDVWSLA